MTAIFLPSPEYEDLEGGNCYTWHAKFQNHFAVIVFYYSITGNPSFTTCAGNASLLSERELVAGEGLDQEITILSSPVVHCGAIEGLTNFASISSPTPGWDVSSPGGS